VIGRGRVLELLGHPGEKSLFPESVLAGRDLKDLRRELDRAYLQRLFRETRGSIPRMLGVLGIRRSYLYSWLRSVGLDVQEMRKQL
jgi:DNA-binding NtrC family response regulator